jgi:hypothetical protein
MPRRHQDNASAENCVLRSRFWFVMPGLGPGIHGVPLPPAVTANLNGYVTRNRVVARVIPGLDAWTGHDGYKTGMGNTFPCPTAYPGAHGVNPAHDGWKTATRVHRVRRLA